MPDNLTFGAAHTRSLPVLASPRALSRTAELTIDETGAISGLFMSSGIEMGLADVGMHPTPATGHWADFWEGAGAPRALDADIEALRAWVLEAMRSCTICEFRCGTDRTRPDVDRRTVCMVGSESRVHQVSTLAGEEPPLSPSAAVFFSGCNFRCSWCHSAAFSHHVAGGALTPATTLARLLADGVPASLQFVGGNPDHHLLYALDVLALARARLGAHMPPVVWNTNFYMTPETVERLSAVVDVWLVDVKWWQDSCARLDGKVPSGTDSLGRNRSYATVMQRNLGLLPPAARVIIRHVPVPMHAVCCTPAIREWAAQEPRLARRGAVYHEPPYLPTSARPLARPLARAMARTTG